MTVPQAEARGLKIPDENLKWNEKEERYEYSEIDWDEFWRVVRGNGPCNRERIEAKRKAYADGAWVREAAEAYAAKRRADRAA
jgi:ring-1,2-phenylacetyl-CoA epoxidase subunit PaaA